MLLNTFSRVPHIKIHICLSKRSINVPALLSPENGSCAFTYQGHNLLSKLGKVQPSTPHGPIYIMKSR